MPLRFNTVFNFPFCWPGIWAVWHAVCFIHFSESQSGSWGSEASLRKDAPMRISYLTALLAGSVALTGVAKADPVSILFGVPSSSTSPVLAYNSGNGSAGILSTSFGGGASLLTVSGSATGSPIIPQPQIQSNTIDIKTDFGVTLDVWVLETGITGPLGIYNMLSGFTSNLLTNASVIESTYVSAADNSFGTIVAGTTQTPSTFAGTLLATQTFTSTINSGLGSVSYTDATPNLTGPYSEVEEYQITFNAGGGEANETISTQAVPEPASLALLGAGMFGLGMIKRRVSATA
jgi:PEP-CTERM motif